MTGEITSESSNYSPNERAITQAIGKELPTIPAPLRGEIFSYLKNNDLLALSLTSKGFNQMMDSFWEGKAIKLGITPTDSQGTKEAVIRFMNFRDNDYCEKINSEIEKTILSYTPNGKLFGGEPYTEPQIHHAELAKIKKDISNAIRKTKETSPTPHTEATKEIAEILKGVSFETWRIFQEKPNLADFALNYGILISPTNFKELIQFGNLELAKKMLTSGIISEVRFVNDEAVYFNGPLNKLSNEERKEVFRSLMSELVKNIHTASASNKTTTPYMDFLKLFFEKCCTQESEISEYIDIAEKIIKNSRHLSPSERKEMLGEIANMKTKEAKRKEDADYGLAG